MGGNIEVRGGFSLSEREKYVMHLLARSVAIVQIFGKLDVCHSLLHSLVLAIWDI